MMIIENNSFKPMPSNQFLPEKPIQNNNLSFSGRFSAKPSDSGNRWQTLRKTILAVGGLLGIGLISYAAIKLMKKDSLSPIKDDAPSLLNNKPVQENKFVNVEITRTQDIEEIVSFSHETIKNESPTHIFPEKRYPWPIAFYAVCTGIFGGIYSLFSKSAKNLPINPLVNIKEDYRGKTVCIDCKVDKDLSFLRHCSHVTSLKIKNADQNLKFNFELFNFNLKSLEIENSVINLNNFNFSSLEIIKSDCSSITNPEGFKLPNLISLEITNTHIHFRNSDFQNLKSLKFNNCPTIDLSESKYPSLNFLEIDGCQNVNFQNSDFSNLELLGIKDCPTIDLNHLKSPKLKKIEIDGCQNVNFKNSDISNMKTFSIKSCPLLDFSNLKFPYLESLEIINSSVNLGDLVLSNLESLKIEGSEKSFTNLKKQCRKHHFSDIFNSFFSSDSSIKNLGLLSNLKNLSIKDSCCIDDFNFLLDLKNLKSIYFSDLQFELFLQKINANVVNFIKENKIKINENSVFNKHCLNFLELMLYISTEYSDYYNGNYDHGDQEKIVLNKSLSIIDLQKTNILFVIATKFNDIKLLDLSVKAGANIDETYGLDNNTVLNICVKKNINNPFIKQMIELGADVNHKNRFNESPLDFLCLNYTKLNSWSNEYVIKCFDQINENNQQAAIHLIQNFKDCEEMKLLCPKLDAQTLMQRAITGQCRDVVKLLLEKKMYVPGQIESNLEFAKEVKKKLMFVNDNKKILEGLILIDEIIPMLIFEKLNYETITADNLLSKLPSNSLQSILGFLDGKSLSNLSQLCKSQRKKIKSLIPSLLNQGKIRVYDLVKGLTDRRYNNLRELEKLIIYIGQENCKKIIKLDLTGCKNSDPYPWDMYLNFPNLKNLVSDGGAKFCKGENNNIKEFSLIGDAYTSEVYTYNISETLTHFHAKDCGNMTDIILTDPTFEKVTIEDCPKLESLDLRFGKSVENPIFIDNCNNLKDLSIYNNQSNIDFEFLKNCENFKKFYLKQVKIFDFKNLEFCLKLENLQIEECETLVFNHQYYSNIKEFKLRSCNLKEGKFLKYFYGVESLNLSGNPNLKDFGFLLELKDLKCLDLSQDQRGTLKKYLDENQNVVKWIKEQKISIFIDGNYSIYERVLELPKEPQDPENDQLAIREEQN